MGLETWNPGNAENVLPTFSSLSSVFRFCEEIGTIEKFEICFCCGGVSFAHPWPGNTGTCFYFVIVVFSIKRQLH